MTEYERGYNQALMTLRNSNYISEDTMLWHWEGDKKNAPIESDFVCFNCQIGGDIDECTFPKFCNNSLRRGGS